MRLGPRWKPAVFPKKIGSQPSIRFGVAVAVLRFAVPGGAVLHIALRTAPLSLAAFGWCWQLPPPSHSLVTVRTTNRYTVCQHFRIRQAAAAAVTGALDGRLRLGVIPQACRRPCRWPGRRRSGRYPDRCKSPPHRKQRRRSRSPGRSCRRRRSCQGQCRSSCASPQLSPAPARFVSQFSSLLAGFRAVALRIGRVAARSPASNSSSSQLPSPSQVSARSTRSQ